MRSTPSASSCLAKLDLFVRAQGKAGCLLAIAQGRVENRDAVSAPCSRLYRHVGLMVKSILMNVVITISYSWRIVDLAELRVFLTVAPSGAFRARRPSCTAPSRP